jgi:GNAT superfamily N-acetyltransferase
MSNPIKITPDKWLSEVLCREVFSLQTDESFLRGMVKRDNDVFSRLNALMARNHVFIYTKISPIQLHWTSFLEEKGFRLVDTNIVLSKPRSVSCYNDKDLHVRFAIPNDEIQTVDLAERSFSFSRFHLDPMLGRKTADLIKAEWVRNFFKGKRGKYLVLAFISDRVAGFLQLLDDTTSNDLIIDLVAVDDQYRRRGIARRMIGFAEACCGDYWNVIVGTQIANIPSLRLYEGMGFRCLNASYVLHYHHL